MSRAGLQLRRYSYNNPTDTSKQPWSLAMLDYTLYLDSQLRTTLYSYGLPQDPRLRRNSQLQEWCSLEYCHVTVAASWGKGTVQMKRKWVSDLYIKNCQFCYEWTFLVWCLDERYTTSSVKTHYITYNTSNYKITSNVPVMTCWHNIHMLSHTFYHHFFGLWWLINLVY